QNGREAARDAAEYGQPGARIEEGAPVGFHRECPVQLLARVGDHVQRQIACVSPEQFRRRMEDDHFASGRGCDFLAAPYESVQVQIADRASAEAPELQVDELPRVRHCDAATLNGRQFARVDDGARLDSICHCAVLSGTSCSVLDMMFTY